jgi:hypothetical protein
MAAVMLELLLVVVVLAVAVGVILQALQVDRGHLDKVLLVEMVLRFLVQAHQAVEAQALLVYQIRLVLVAMVEQELAQPLLVKEFSMLVAVEAVLIIQQVLTLLRD